MIGLADQADIMPIKAGISGSTNAAAVTAGIRYAVDHGAAVINISRASYFADSALTSAIDSALAHGVIVVVAAGSNATTGNEPNGMADVPGVLDVGGIDSTGRKDSFSHYGSDVNVAAPANGIEVGLAKRSVQRRRLIRYVARRTVGCRRGCLAGHGAPNLDVGADRGDDHRQHEAGGGRAVSGRSAGQR